jgi:hypothetical protein
MALLEEVERDAVRREVRLDPFLVHLPIHLIVLGLVVAPAADFVRQFLPPELRHQLIVATVRATGWRVVVAHGPARLRLTADDTRITPVSGR